MNNSFINLAKRSRLKVINILGNNENNLPPLERRNHKNMSILFYNTTVYNIYM